jgi:hypothetical protein
VDYSFEVGGKPLRGSKISPGSTMSFDLGTAQDIVNRYQAGTAVTVHYDPADPTQAVLETSSRSANLLMLACSSALVGDALAVAIWLFMCWDLHSSIAAPSRLNSNSRPPDNGRGHLAV